MKFYIVICLFFILFYKLYLLKKTKEKFLLYFYKDHGNKIVDRNKCINNCLNNNSRKYCGSFLPDTYRINNKDDMIQLNNNYSSEDWFIAKETWGQQRRGLKLIQKKNINHKSLKGYDEIQKLVLNSLKINNRVFHIRIYVIVDCNRGIYFFKDGIMIYCKKEFDKNNICRDNIITASGKSGYQNKSFCDKNRLPKTLTEFYLYLLSKNRSYKLLENNIIKNLKKYFSLFKFCKKDPPKNFKTKHLYGPDIIVEENLDCKILEVNQVPDMLIKTKNQEIAYKVKLKKKLYHSYLESNYSKNFIKLY